MNRILHIFRLLFLLLLLFYRSSALENLVNVISHSFVCCSLVTLNRFVLF